MSHPAKRREVETKVSDINSESEESSENEEDKEEKDLGLIQVDFEGRQPTDSDFHGIKRLLQQLFLKAHVNLSEMSNLIISQGYVSSVLKQCYNDETVDDDEDEDPNEVFGVTSVINLYNSRECTEQLRDLLVDLCKKYGTEPCNNLVQELVSSQSRPGGLIINERFVNIPAEVSVPLLTSLSKEIRRAAGESKPYNFSYYVFICKLYKNEGKEGQEGKKKKKSKSQDEVIWLNPEEEIIDEECDFKFEFCVKKQSDSGLTGNWLEEDESMTPYRKVLFLPAEKLEDTISKIKAAF